MAKSQSQLKRERGADESPIRSKRVAATVKKSFWVAYSFVVMEHPVLELPDLSVIMDTWDCQAFLTTSWTETTNGRPGPKRGF